MRFTLCQISNKLINPPTGSLAEEFYEAIWQNKADDGYWKHDDFWELPQWMAEVAYTIPSEHECRLHIVTDVNAELPDSSFYLFSVLDVNLPFVQAIMRNNPDKFFVCGGYVEPSACHHASWCHSVKDLCETFGWTYRYGTDYSLFRGTRCIPRLTLSTGCKFKCKFCIVPNEVVERSHYEILQQVDSFRSLGFKLVYVDDKTWGQASNYKYLAEVYNFIKCYNPDFEGFIVQTTAGTVVKMGDDVFERCHVKVVEIGVETFNDDLLQRYRKPTSCMTTTRAVQKLSRLGVKCIANVILGLPGETFDTYAATYRFLRQADLYALNTYTLAAYDDSDLNIEVKDGDKDELNDSRSFWTDGERDAFDLWSPSFYILGKQIVEV